MTQISYLESPAVDVNCDQTFLFTPIGGLPIAWIVQRGYLHSVSDKPYEWPMTWIA